MDVFIFVTCDLVDLDDSRFPLVILTLSGDLQDSDYQDIFSRIEHLLGRRLPFVMISDLRGLTSVANAQRRQQIADQLQYLEEKFGKLEKGTVRIVDSAVIRSELTALQWVTGRRDVDWVKDMPNALSLAHEIAKRVGLTIPGAKGEPTLPEAAMAPCKPLVPH